MTNYIYTPDSKGFRCRVPLDNTQQLFVANGVLQPSNVGDIVTSDLILEVLWEKEKISSFMV